MSNDPLDRDGGGSQAVALPAGPDHLHDALRLILGGSRRASDEQVLDFLSFALHRRIDLNAAWVVMDRGRVVWSVLPVNNPGRTILLLAPTRLPPGLSDTHLRPLVKRILAISGQHDMHLAQVLIDPLERSLIDFYMQCGFDELAELVYLERVLGRRIEPKPLPAGMTWLPYTPQTHGLFARAIEESYQQSLDCPALNGRRDIEDIIAGHKAVGDFDPSLWTVLMADQQPLGVVLVSAPERAEAAELVYLGLCPAARGHGWGDVAMTHALLGADRAGADRLTLAVDARNAPAMRLYLRHGMRRLCSRTALIHDLRPAAPAALGA